MHDIWYDHLVLQLLHHMFLWQICRIRGRFDGRGRWGGLDGAKIGWARQSSLSASGSVSNQTNTSIHGKKLNTLIYLFTIAFEFHVFEMVLKYFFSGLNVCRKVYCPNHLGHVSTCIL